MLVKRSAVRSSLAVGVLGGAVAMGVSMALLAALPLQASWAQSTATCAATWSAGAVYTGGNQASENGVNYQANWWTQGEEPVTHNGGAGSGQPWTSLGGCGGGGTPPADPPPTDPPPTNPNPPATGFLFSPYKDVTINLNWNTNAMRTAVTGSPIPLVGGGSLLTREPKLGAITLAFASGECGSENWGGIPSASFVGANIQPLVNAGLNYVVSTGGQAGSFTCGSSAGMVKFIGTYASSRLVGIDFDIESGQSQAQINSLAAAVAYAQTVYPNLRFSFTLATLGASDGSYGGLNGTGDMVVKAVLAAGIRNYTINLMVMDFGGASAGVCVVSGGACDMGRTAIQAALNLRHSYGIAASHIELTPMIGVNDVSSELFNLADVDTVTNYAVSQSMAGVHYWSLDRDTPCAGNTGTASPICNSVGGSAPLQYTDRFLHDLGR